MRLSLAGDRPQDLSALVNAVSDAYLDEVLSKDHTDRSASSSKLKTLLDEYTERLTARRTELRKLAEKVGSDDKNTLALKQQFAIQQLRRPREGRSFQEDAEAELKRSTAELAVHRTQGTTAPPAPLDAAAVAEAMAADPLLERFRAQVDDLDVKIRRTVRIVRSRTDPAVRDLQLKRAAVQQALEVRQEELRPKVEREIRGRLGDPKGDKVGELELQVNVLTQYEAMLRDGIERLERDAQSFNHQTIDLQWMKDEVTQWEETARQLGKQYEALNVELKAPQRGRIISRADRPRIESAKKRLAAVGMVALAAFGCTVVGASWREYRFRRVDSADEVVEGLGLSPDWGPLRALPQWGKGAWPPPAAPVPGPARPRTRAWSRSLLRSSRWTPPERCSCGSAGLTTSAR